jgi:hypothetical protein
MPSPRGGGVNKAYCARANEKAGACAPAFMIQQVLPLAVPKLRY